MILWAADCNEMLLFGFHLEIGKYPSFPIWHSLFAKSQNRRRLGVKGFRFDLWKGWEVCELLHNEIGKLCMVWSDLVVGFIWFCLWLHWLSDLHCIVPDLKRAFFPFFQWWSQAAEASKGKKKSIPTDPKIQPQKKSGISFHRVETIHWIL